MSEWHRPNIILTMEQMTSCKKRERSITQLCSPTRSYMAFWCLSAQCLGIKGLNLTVLVHCHCSYQDHIQQQTEAVSSKKLQTH